MNHPENTHDAARLDPLDRQLLKIDEQLEHHSVLAGDTPRQAADPTAVPELANDSVVSMSADQFAAQCLHWIEAIRVTAPEELEAAFCGSDQATVKPASTVYRQEAKVDGSRAAVSPADNRIGRFELVSELGRGGYGIVFLARDPTLQRDVALKVPRPEVLVTADLRSRFLREAKAAAALDHRHIVPLYEAGAVGPICYIAAAYCSGVTLTQWLNERGQVMDPRLAAAVLAVLASAVDHAHQRGILHRDIKPGNVLVQREDESHPQQLVESVRLTDFGLARVVAESTDQTLSAAILGTPAYMAPEQAASRREQIGVQTDVYGLGATLYHLLTGRPPIVGSSQIETLSAILSTDPLDPTSYRSEVPRDLSAICMKCLEKDPRCRYASAADLQADLQRFLHGHQVIARPVGQIQRLIKWSRRNPKVATLSVVSILAGLLALIVSVAGWWSTSRALRREQAALAMADEAYNETKQAVDQYYVTVSENQLLNAPGMTALRKQLLEQALDYYNRFVDHHQQDAAAADELQKAHVRIANVHDQLGDVPAARTAYEKALQLASSTADDDPQSSQRRLQQGMIHRKLARLDRRVNDLPAALAHAKKSQQLHEALIEQEFELDKNHDQLAQTLSVHGNILQAMGQHADAVQLYQRAESLIEALLARQAESAELRLRLAQLRGNRSIALRMLGKIVESKPLLQSSADVYRQLVHDFPEIPSYRENLGKALANLSLYESTAGDFEPALADLAEATDLFDGLAIDFPRVANYPALRGTTRKEAASILTAIGRLEEARRLLSETVKIYEASTNTSAAMVVRDLYEAQLALGTVALQLGDLDGAQPLIDSATEGLRQEHRRTPRDFLAGAGLVLACQQQALVSAAEQQWDQAMQWLDQGYDVLRSLKEIAPENRQVDQMVAANHACRASFWERQQQWPQAVEFRKQALQATFDRNRGIRHAELATALAYSGDVTQAESNLAEAEATWDGQAMSWLPLARAHAVLAETYEPETLPPDESKGKEKGLVTAKSIADHHTKALDALRNALNDPAAPNVLRELERNEDFAVLKKLPGYDELTGTAE